MVNEAMCFSLPVLVSSQVGAARDLVHDGENGFIFPSGEVDQLARCMQQIVDLTEEERIRMGSVSRQIIEKWVNRKLAKHLDQYFDFIYSNRLPRKK